MMKKCRQCTATYALTDDDVKFLDKVSPVFAGNKYSIPLPTLCPVCRQQRRLTWRNERKLYQRDCGLCRQQVITVYSPYKPFTVYCAGCWWSDRWNPLDYGREFDFSKPFFEQFGELMKVTPLPANMTFNSVNCDYNSFVGNSKDCYLCQRVVESEKLFYSYLCMGCYGCVDCDTLTKCQLCYECFDCENCYNLVFSTHCKNTSDSAFCYDCIGCSNCFGCVGLRNCKYYIFNKPHTKEEYEEFMRKNNPGSHENLLSLRGQFAKHLAGYPRKFALHLNAQNVTGDFIFGSRDVENGFDIMGSESIKDSTMIEFSKDVHDGDYIYGGEKCYEQMSNFKSSNILFSAVAIEGCADLLYCFMCVNGANNSFGSVALNKNRFCILNRQYSKEEYEKMVSRILDHMRQTGAAAGQAREFGEFFPAGLSPFAYDETLALELHPLSKEQVMARKWLWKGEEKKAGPPSLAALPDRINETPESVTREVLACAECGGNYKIVPQELELLKKMPVPLPRVCPPCRFTARSRLRNPRALYDRRCRKCDAELQTTYAPDRPEKIFCEKCYLDYVY